MVNINTCIDINNCQDFGMQAGNYIQIYFDFYYPDGSPMPLSTANSYGCTLSVADENEKVPLVVINGKRDTSSQKGNTMIIEILSEYTKNLDYCILYYRPYITIGTNTRRWQGRITIGGTTPFN